MNYYLYYYFDFIFNFKDIEFWIWILIDFQKRYFEMYGSLKYSFPCLVQIADKGRLRVMLFIEMGKENVQVVSVP